MSQLWLRECIITGGYVNQRRVDVGCYFPDEHDSVIIKTVVDDVTSLKNVLTHKYNRIIVESIEDKGPIDIDCPQSGLKRVVCIAVQGMNVRKLVDLMYKGIIACPDKVEALAKKMCGDDRTSTLLISALRRGSVGVASDNTLMVDGDEF